MREALQPEIQSERLILRAWRPSDAEALFALFNNWEVVRWLSFRREFIARLFGGSRSGEGTGS
jgi:RimJ/RimL family protein N-acetyltransferase